MSEENKALIRRYIDEALNAAAYERLEEFIAPEYVNHTTGTRGPDGYRRAHLMLRSVFPDFHIAIEQMISEGDIVAMHMMWSGTHTGSAFRGVELAPTGRHVQWPSTQFRRIVNGMVVEGWGGNDLWRLLQQCGVVPFKHPVFG